MKQKRLSAKIAAIVTISLTVVFGLLMATVVLLSGKTTRYATREDTANETAQIDMDIQKLFTPSEIERLRQ